jgi:hypothetical protein
LGYVHTALYSLEPESLKRILRCRYTLVLHFWVPLACFGND